MFTKLERKGYRFSRGGGIALDADSRSVTIWSVRSEWNKFFWTADVYSRNEKPIAEDKRLECTVRKVDKNRTSKTISCQCWCLSSLLSLWSGIVSLPKLPKKWLQFVFCNVTRQSTNVFLPTYFNTSPKRKLIQYCFREAANLIPHNKPKT